MKFSVYLDKVPKPDDIEEAEAAEATQDLQAGSQELPQSESNEHKRGNVGTAAEKVVAGDPAAEPERSDNHTNTGKKTLYNLQVF